MLFGFYVVKKRGLTGVYDRYKMYGACKDIGCTLFTLLLTGLLFTGIVRLFYE